jgi:hypothetical protein
MSYLQSGPQMTYICMKVQTKKQPVNQKFQIKIGLVVNDKTDILWAKELNNGFIYTHEDITTEYFLQFKVLINITCQGSPKILLEIC